MRFAFLLALLLAGLAVPAARRRRCLISPTRARATWAPDLAAVQSIRFLTTADFPPFDYRDKSGVLVGYNVDLARAICTELKLGCTIQAWPWEQASKALDDNQGAALVAGLAVTPENCAQFDFSDIYLGFPGRFVTRTAAVRGFDPAKLAGRTVAVAPGHRA